MRHDDDHARLGARILSRDAARAPPGRPRTPRNSGISCRAGTRGECTLPSTRHMNLTAVATARHSQGLGCAMPIARATSSLTGRRVAEASAPFTREFPNSRLDLASFRRHFDLAQFP